MGLEVYQTNDILFVIGVVVCFVLGIAAGLKR
jgi:hypothetical protein